MTGIYLGRLGGRYHNSIVMDGARIRIINKSSGRGSSWSEPCRVEKKTRKRGEDVKMAKWQKEEEKMPMAKLPAKYF